MSQVKYEVVSELFIKSVLNLFKLKNKYGSIFECNEIGGLYSEALNFMLESIVGKLEEIKSYSSSHFNNNIKNELYQSVGNSKELTDTTKKSIKDCDKMLKDDEQKEIIQYCNALMGKLLINKNLSDYMIIIWIYYKIIPVYIIWRKEPNNHMDEIEYFNKLLASIKMNYKINSHQSTLHAVMFELKSFIKKMSDNQKESMYQFLEGIWSKMKINNGIIPKEII